MKIVHGNKKLHQCNSCGKAFSEAQNLKKHINSVHNGQKDHKCDSCGKAFWHQWHLRRHINGYHKKLKPASCDVCDKSFSKAPFLKKHKCMAGIKYAEVFKLRKEENYRQIEGLLNSKSSTDSDFKMSSKNKCKYSNCNSKTNTKNPIRKQKGKVVFVRGLDFLLFLYVLDV